MLGTTRISLILADGHELLRKSISSFLRGEPSFTVLGECADGAELLAAAARLRPDVVLIDASSPALNGLDLVRKMRVLPQPPRVIFLSDEADGRSIRAALDAGAVGYVSKSGAARRLIDAIRFSSQGRVYLCPEIRAAAHDKLMNSHGLGGMNGRRDGAGRDLYAGAERRHSDRRTRAQVTATCPLTPREREVLRLIAEGLCCKQIASSLGISQSTVITHRNNAKEKLGVNNVAGLIRCAISFGLVQV
ncbi:MAG: response regulator [Pyrinomonadaceae bacterium]